MTSYTTNVKKQDVGPVKDNLCKITNFLHEVKHQISLSGVQENIIRISNSLWASFWARAVHLVDIMFFL